MRIRYFEEYRKIKDKMNKRITSNPMYKYHFEYAIEDLLREGKELDLIVFQDGSARLRVSPEEDNRLGQRSSKAKVIAIYPTANNGFRVANVEGSVVDADDYYKNPTTGARPQIPVKCVMNVDQRITTVDEDGVEIEYVAFFTSGVPIRENCFNDADVFTAHILTQGVLSFVGDFSDKDFEKTKQSYLQHEYRDPDNPALVTRHIVQKDSEGEIMREDYYLGVNMSKYAEVLRLEDGDIFATKAKAEDDWTVYKDRIRGGDITIDEAIKNATVNYGNNLESSRTKRNNSPEYESLRKRCDAALEAINHRLVRQ